MGSEPQFTAQINSRDGVASIALRGELDLATVSDFEGHLTSFESDGVSAIVLDLRELTFIDSVALRSLVRARERAQRSGQQLILVGARPTARRLFELTSTEYMLDDQGAGVPNRSVEKFHGAGAKMPAARTLVARSSTNVQRENGGR